MVSEVQDVKHLAFQIYLLKLVFLELFTLSLGNSMPFEIQLQTVLNLKALNNTYLIDKGVVALLGNKILV